MSARATDQTRSPCVINPSDLSVAGGDTGSIHRLVGDIKTKPAGSAVDGRNALFVPNTDGDPIYVYAGTNVTVKVAAPHRHDLDDDVSDGFDFKDRTATAALETIASLHMRLAVSQTATPPTYYIPPQTIATKPLPGFIATEYMADFTPFQVIRAGEVVHPVSFNALFGAPDRDRGIRDEPSTKRLQQFIDIIFHQMLYGENDPRLVDFGKDAAGNIIRIDHDGAYGPHSLQYRDVPIGEPDPLNSHEKNQLKKITAIFSEYIERERVEEFFRRMGQQVKERAALFAYFEQLCRNADTVKWLHDVLTEAALLQLTIPMDSLHDAATNLQSCSSLDTTSLLQTITENKYQLEARLLGSHAFAQRREDPNINAWVATRGLANCYPTENVLTRATRYRAEVRRIKHYASSASCAKQDYMHAIDAVRSYLKDQIRRLDTKLAYQNEGGMTPDGSLFAIRQKAILFSRLYQAMPSRTALTGLNTAELLSLMQQLAAHTAMIGHHKRSGINLFGHSKSWDAWEKMQESLTGRASQQAFALASKPYEIMTGRGHEYQLHTLGKDGARNVLKTISSYTEYARHFMGKNAPIYFTLSSNKTASGPRTTATDLSSMQEFGMHYGALSTDGNTPLLHLMGAYKQRPETSMIEARCLVTEEASEEVEYEQPLGKVMIEIRERVDSQSLNVSAPAHDTPYARMREKDSSCGMAVDMGRTEIPMSSFTREDMRRKEAFDAEHAYARPKLD